MIATALLTALFLLFAAFLLAMVVAEHERNAEHTLYHNHPFDEGADYADVAWVGCYYCDAALSPWAVAVGRKFCNATCNGLFNVTEQLDQPVDDFGQPFEPCTDGSTEHHQSAVQAAFQAELEQELRTCNDDKPDGLILARHGERAPRCPSCGDTIEDGQPYCSAHCALDSGMPVQHGGAGGVTYPDGTHVPSRIDDDLSDLPF